MGGHCEIVRASQCIMILCLLLRFTAVVAMLCHHIAFLYTAFDPAKLCSIPGRTDQQCMGRWRRHLDPNIRKCQWQPEEDATLQEKYNEQGPQWSSISKFLDGRTAQQCRARWFQLCPPEAAAAPAFPAHRGGNNRKDRIERCRDGAVIQESARQLLVQMEAEGDAALAHVDAPRRNRGPARAHMHDPLDSSDELSPRQRPVFRGAGVLCNGCLRDDTPG
jgi:Myb-like DNA-binding domain